MIKWFALVALFWAIPASAKNWYLVATSDSKTTAYFIDRDSIVSTGASTASRNRVERAFDRRYRRHRVARIGA